MPERNREVDRTGDRPSAIQRWRRLRGRSRARAAALTVASAALAAALALAVSSALAAKPPPSFQGSTLITEAFPTRLRARVDVNLFEVIEAHWQAEYATSEGGPWQPAGSETPLGSHNSMAAQIGELAVPAHGSDFIPAYLRHLTPNTTYYVRFHAQDANGEATFGPEALKTTPAAAPETVKAEFSFPEVPPKRSTLVSLPPSPHSVILYTGIETNGAESAWQLEYATSEAGPFTTCGTGSIAAEPFATAPGYSFVEAQCSGLKPETRYYGRVTAHNTVGGFSEPMEECQNEACVHYFTTASAKPSANLAELRDVTATSATLTGNVIPHGSETHWHFEQASAPTGPWNPISGAEGTITQARAEALESEHNAEHEGGGAWVAGGVSGLHPASAYYVRLVAENSCSEGCGSAASSPTDPYHTLRTFGPPVVQTFAAHAIHGESLRLLGAVDPNSLPTSAEQEIATPGQPTSGSFTLTFQGQTTPSLPYNASANEVQQALSGLPAKPAVQVSVLDDSSDAKDGGPYRVYFPTPESEPQIECRGTGLTCTASTLLQGGESYDTHGHYEYEPASGSEPFKHALSTGATDLGSGDQSVTIGQDLPALAPGETYRFRISATSTAPGNPVVQGAEATLTAPNAPIEPEPVCPNAQYRTGLSGHLPDCRAYEQISPVDKEGAQEALKYGTTKNTGGDLGEDGEHFMFMSSDTRWGTSATSGQAPYLFSRTASGWQMTPGSPQPQTGFYRSTPEVFSPNATQVGLLSYWSTGIGLLPGRELGGGIAQSSNVEFKVGAVGGPYTTVATVPARLLKQNEHEEFREGWLAASEDFSKLILGLEDHTLLGHSTGTTQGIDLYEFSGGALRQANVDSEGHTIGSCGASMANGEESVTQSTRTSSRHALSGDGARVFFEAVPTGQSCGEPKHLYMREAAAGRTIDIGAYKFVGADSQGSAVLLEKESDGEHEYFLYHLETSALKAVFSFPTNACGTSTCRVAVSRDFTAVYFYTAAQITGTSAPSAILPTVDIYRFDVASETVHFVVQETEYAGLERYVNGTSGTFETSPDGRFLYFMTEDVAGVPGGAPELHEDGSLGPKNSIQLYRYDSGANAVECVSCASAFDPEPRLGVNDSGGSLSVEWPSNGQPQAVFSSADGSEAFFETPAALVSQDANGEVPLDTILRSGRSGGSPSNDVYEWRRDGAAGCAHLQGCLSLITPGTQDGWLVSLRGTTADGRDVVFYTSQSLVPQDNDTAGDFYDARIDGGIAEPSAPVECEGDACLKPAPAPVDSTPASLAFSGPGNLVASLSPAALPPRPAHPPACRKGMVRKHGRCVRKRRPRSARKSSHRPASRARRGRRP